MELDDLEIYQLAKEVASDSWNIYKTFDWQTKKIMGDQFIRSVDSVAANIAEGFGRFHYLDRNKFNLPPEKQIEEGRFHYLDRNKFNYNARGSLFEASHWASTLQERNIISTETNQRLQQKIKQLSIKLNNYITTTKSLKQ